MKRAKAERNYGGISAADRRAERRLKLVTAGRQIWGEAGITEVTVRGVCSAAGLIPRYFYEEFPSREALLFAVADDARDQTLQAMVAAALADTSSVDGVLRAAVQAFLDVVAADPHIHRIATSDMSSVPGLTEHRAHVVDIITDLVVQYAPGILGDDTPDAANLRRVAQFMVGGANQIIEGWLADPKESSTELAAVCADLCMAVIRGVVPPSD